MACQQFGERSLPTTYVSCYYNMHNAELYLGAKLAIIFKTKKFCMTKMRKRTILQVKWFNDKNICIDAVTTLRLGKKRVELIKKHRVNCDTFLIKAIFIIVVIRFLACFL